MELGSFLRRIVLADSQEDNFKWKEGKGVRPYHRLFCNYRLWRATKIKDGRPRTGLILKDISFSRRYTQFESDGHPLKDPVEGGMTCKSFLNQEAARLCRIERGVFI